MAHLSKVENFGKEVALLTMSAFVITLYPVLFLFLLIISIYRLVIQQIVTRDPKVERILSGMDASLAAHNTYTPKTMLCPVYLVSPKVDINHIVKVFNDKIISPKENAGKCLYPELTLKIVRKWGYNWLHSVDNFTVKSHIRYLDEKDPDKVISKEELSTRIKEELLKLPFNPELSPWELIIVKKLVDEKDPTVKAAILFRFNHCLCDGYSQLKIMKTLAANPWKDLGGSMTMPKTSLLHSILHFLLILLTTPYYSLKLMYFTNDQNDWTRKAIDEYTGSLMAHQVEPIAISTIKNVRDKNKVSFSSVIIFIATEAILRSMARDNATKNVDKIHFAMPFPLPNHPPGKITNHWSVLKMPINICKDNPLQTLKNIEDEFRNLRYSVAPLVGFYVSKVIGFLPVPMIPEADELMRSTCVMTNFPGPLHEIDIFGYKVKEIGTAAIAPKGYAVQFASISYNGKVTITTGGDKSIFGRDGDVQFLTNSCLDALNFLRSDKEHSRKID